jgi:hypothetical protein
MSQSPIVLLRIVSGTWGMLSGFVAAFLLKGPRRHGIAGNLFCHSQTGPVRKREVCLELMKSQPGNVLGGTSSFYGNHGMADRPAQGWHTCNL